MNRFGKTLFSFYKDTLFFTPVFGGAFGLYNSNAHIDEIQNKIGRDKEIPYLHLLGYKLGHTIGGMFIFGICYPVSVPYYYWKTHNTYLKNT